MSIDFFSSENPDFPDQIWSKILTTNTENILFSSVSYCEHIFSHTYTHAPYIVYSGVVSSDFDRTSKSIRVFFDIDGGVVDLSS